MTISKFIFLLERLIEAGDSEFVVDTTMLAENQIVVTGLDMRDSFTLTIDKVAEQDNEK